MKSLKLTTLFLGTTMIVSSLSTPVLAENVEAPDNTGNAGEIFDATNETSGSEVLPEEENEAETDVTQQPAASGQAEESGNEAALEKQDTEKYNLGAAVIADSNSPSGYTVRFAYDPSKDSRLSNYTSDQITGVKVSGSFHLLSGNTDLSEESDHDLTQYQNGDYCSNLHLAPRASGKQFFHAGSELDMQKVGDQYQLSVPIVSGAHAYQYVVHVDDGSESGIDLSFDDPSNPSPTKNNQNSDYIDSSIMGDYEKSIVYGKWDPIKQSQSPNLDFTLPDTEHAGKVEYVEYTGVISDHQDLGIYLPHDYDANRSEPYKVIYTSHGMGGNETYWFAMAQANNIMDHIAEEDPSQEAIIVNMDNSTFDWDYEDIGNNVVNYIIPYMNEHYNVSKAKEDRAFCGFSMGSMTTTYMAFHYPDVFGYFGIFSGCNIGNATFKDDFVYDDSKLQNPATDEGATYLQQVYDNIKIPDELKNDLVFTMAGTADSAVFANGFAYYGAYETIRNFGQSYLPQGSFVDGGLVPGSHDLYTWAQCFNTFAKDIVWSRNTTSDDDNKGTVAPDDSKNPSNSPSANEEEKPNTEQPSNSNQKSYSTPKTGYTSKIPLYTGLSVISSALAIAAYLIRRRH